MATLQNLLTADFGNTSSIRSQDYTPAKEFLELIMKLKATLRKEVR